MTAWEPRRRQSCFPSIKNKAKLGKASAWIGDRLRTPKYDKVVVPQKNQKNQLPVRPGSPMRRGGGGRQKRPSVRRKCSYKDTE